MKISRRVFILPQCSRWTISLPNGSKQKVISRRALTSSHVSNKQLFLFSIQSRKKQRRHNVWYFSNPPSASFVIAPVKIPGNGFFFPLPRWSWKKSKSSWNESRETYSRFSWDRFLIYQPSWNFDELWKHRHDLDTSYTHFSEMWCSHRRTLGNGRFWIRLFHSRSVLKSQPIFPDSPFGQQKKQFLKTVTKEKNKINVWFDQFIKFREISTYELPFINADNPVTSK